MINDTDMRDEYALTDHICVPQKSHMFKWLHILIYRVRECLEVVILSGREEGSDGVY